MLMKVNSELTSVTSTSEKKLAMALCNGPRKKMGGWAKFSILVNNLQCMFVHVSISGF